MKPKAKLLIKVWNKEHTRFMKKPKENYIQWRDKGTRYYYFYTEQELKDAMQKAGFKIISSVSEENGFQKQEIVVMCEK